MKQPLFVFLNFLFYACCYSQTGWIQQNSGTTIELTNVSFINSTTGIAAGSGGIFLKTTNGGNNWSIINSGINYNTTALAFPTSSIILAGIMAQQNKILKSTNGGVAWDTASQIGSWCFSFINNTTGYCIWWYNQLYKTSNSGINWTLVSSYPITTNVARAIHFRNESTGYVCGTWWSQSFNFFWSFIFKSTDGGSNWNAGNYNGPFGQNYVTMYDIDFANDQYGFALEHLTNPSVYKLFRSSNYGLNWASQQLAYPVNSIDFVNFNNGWICGNGVILYSSDGGNNFVLQQSPVNSNLNKVFMVDQNTGWIVGSNGVILKTINGGVTPVKPIGEQIPVSYSLYQNYPNPFNPVTKIKFDIPMAKTHSNASLRIYDILGREISTLVDQHLKPGTYEIEWDATNYPSGVYFYKLQAGDYSETEKMVLLK